MTPQLSDPLRLARGVTWSNRLVLAPMTNRQSGDDGVLHDDERRWLCRRAKGGFGFVTTCATSVDPSGRGWSGELGAWSDDHLPGLRFLAESLSLEGAATGLQLNDAGARAESQLVEDRRGPWSDPARGARAMSTREIKAAIDSFVAAAVRAELAGFDGVQVHAAHGYLVAQFLDARRNQRADGYGGDAEGRSRFLWDVIRGIRASTGEAFQLGVRLSPERWGIRLRDSLFLAQELMASGEVDYLDVSLWDVTKAPEGAASEALLIDQFCALERFDTRLGVAGKVGGAAQAAWCLARGADYVAVGTAAIVDADFALAAIRDRQYLAVSGPLPEQHFREQAVGEAFIAYLKEIRPALVINPATEPISSHADPATRT